MLNGIPVRRNVTDRALRYRANQEPPEGPLICCYCGSKTNVEIEHVNGFEEDNEPENKCWACRRCNTKKGALMARLGMGRRTVQYNPVNPARGAASLGQWMTAVLSAKGESDAMGVADAVDMIRATSPARRSDFAREIWGLRRSHGTDSSSSAVPF
jgi:hypothetical protein